MKMYKVGDKIKTIDNSCNQGPIEIIGFVIRTYPSYDDKTSLYDIISADEKISWHRVTGDRFTLIPSPIAKIKERIEECDNARRFAPSDNERHRFAFGIDLLNEILKELKGKV